MRRPTPRLIKPMFTVALITALAGCCGCIAPPGMGGPGGGGRGPGGGDGAGAPRWHGGPPPQWQAERERQGERGDSPRQRPRRGDTDESPSERP